MTQKVPAEGLGQTAVPEFSGGGTETESVFPSIVVLTIDMLDRGARNSGEGLKNMVNFKAEKLVLLRAVSLAL
jgi:hypothetical protein